MRQTSTRPSSPSHGRRLIALLGCTLALMGPAASALAQTPSASKPEAAQPTRVELDTNLGAIVVQLDAQRAPRTVANFLQYVNSGFYAGTVFHRVIPGFMIQGGGYTADLQQKATRGPIPLESRNGLRNLRGTIAMARTSVPDSATSQFFINLVNNFSLDYPQPDGFGYAVFGRVISGMKVVDRIATVTTHDAGPMQNVPVQPVIIRSARVLR